MKVWAIADLHLAKGVPDKSMEVFGAKWGNYMELIETHWRGLVASDDLVLLAGDISWAMKLEQAAIDLTWIDSLPGTKVMIRGNHDYWWSSASKVRSILPPTIHIIQNDSFTWNGISIGGARLWETDEYSFGAQTVPYSDEDRKIFQRELHRLELSLKTLSTDKRIVMTHYPPIGMEGKPSLTSKMLEAYNVSLALFGHLHHLPSAEPLIGEWRGVKYFLTSSDYLGFTPYRLM